MPLLPLDLADADDLIDAVVRSNKPIAVLVGAALSAPMGSGEPGVPGVSGVVELVRQRVERAALPVDAFQREMESGPDSTRYQRALAWLRKKTSQDEVNTLIHEAVLKARLPGARSDLEADRLEEDHAGWWLSPGHRALGRLLAGPKWRGPVLTTNFDPLVQVAARAAGVMTTTLSLARDGSLGQLRPTPDQRLVAHLHGFWRDDDTLHTPQQLLTGRPQLAASLRRILEGHLLVVLAYGGWDDVFTRALREVMADKSSRLDVRWAFYSGDLTRVQVENERLLESMADAITAGRFQAHVGVDAHKVLPALAERMLGAGAPAAPAPAAPASGPAVVLPPTAEPAPPPVSYDPGHRLAFLPFEAKGARMIGREDGLRRVRAQLLSARAATIGQAAAFTGLGGIGKTQLAVEYAIEYGDDYPGGIVWITADEDLDGQILRLAQHARWVNPITEPSVRLQLARHRLTIIEQALFIFDNVERIDTIRHLLPAARQRCHLLLTSRTEQPGFEPVPLSLLPDALALELLASESGRVIDDEDAAKRIVHFLDGLPLGIELAAAYLRRRPTLSLGEYADQLDRKGVSAKGMEQPGLELALATRHEASIHRTLTLAGPLLDAHPGLDGALDFLGWSASAAMGWPMMAAVLVPEDADVLRDGVDLAAALHVLRPEAMAEGAGRPRFRMHRLVQQVRRLDHPMAERSGQARVWLGRVWAWFRDRRQNFADLAAFEAELDHLEAWQGHAKMLGEEDAWVRLQWLRAYPRWHRGDYRGAWEALEAARGKGTADRELEAHLLADAGVISGALGRLTEALDLSERALKLRLELFGERHVDTARSCANVSGHLCALGRYEQALKYAMRALEVRKGLFGERHPDTADSYADVGNISSYFGQKDEALRFSSRALDLRRALLGERHPDTARSYGAVGSMYAELGRYDKALEHTACGLRLHKELLGERHPETAWSYSSVGVAYAGLRQHKEALEHLTRALELRKELLGERHPDTANSYRNVGESYRALGEPVKALEFTARALELRRDLLGDTHPHTVNSYLSMLIVLDQLRRRGDLFDLASAAVNRVPSSAPRYSELIAYYNKSAPPGFSKLGPGGPAARSERKSKKKR